MCLILNPEKDFNHLPIIIKLNLNIVPPYVNTLVHSQDILCDISAVQCSRKTGSSSALFFRGEMFVHTIVIASILSTVRA